MINPEMIFNDKTTVRNHYNYDNLNNIMNNEGINILENHNNSIMIQLNEPYNSNIHDSIINKCMTNWFNILNIKLDCPSNFSYNILPLKGNKVIIRI